MRIFLCECGQLIDGSTFKDYIKKSICPSTPTIGQPKCALIFNVIDGEMAKSSFSK